MSMRHKVEVRGGAAVALAAALALTMAGCGGDDEKNPEQAGTSTTHHQPSAGGPVSPSAQPSPSAETVLATVKGRENIVLVINSVTRDAGGFLTVNGQIKNQGTMKFVDTAPWRGADRDVNASGESVAGATLVDKVGKKRFYVLRDTDGRCLCTMGISSVDAGETVPVFAQFPAPAAGTTEVDLMIPTFATATVKISG